MNKDSEDVSGFDFSQCVFHGFLIGSVPTSAVVENPNFLTPFEPGSKFFPTQDWMLQLKFHGSAPCIHLWGRKYGVSMNILPSRHCDSDYVGISKTLYGGDAIFLMALSLMFLLSVSLSRRVSKESFRLVLVISK